MTWAFSDESERANRMMFGIVFVEAQHTYELRKQLLLCSCPDSDGCTWRRKAHVAAESFLML